MKNFEQAHDDLSKTRPDGKGAIRAAFDAAEKVFKVMFPKEPRLTARAARMLLAPLLQKLYDGNGPAWQAHLPAGLGQADSPPVRTCRR